MPPEPGGNAERLEKSVAHPERIRDERLTALHNGWASELSRRHALKAARLLAPILESSRPHATQVACARLKPLAKFGRVGLEDQSQPIGLGKRKRRENHPFCNAVDRGVRADAKGQNPDHNEREREIFVEQAETKTQITGAMVEPGDPASLAMILAELRDAAELPSSGVMGIFGGHSLANEMLSERLDVRFNFLLQFAIRGVAVEKTAETGS